MIAVDTNILVYAHREESPWHAAAGACLTGLAEGRAAWAIPWPCLHELFAIVTHARIYSPPTPPGVARDLLDELLKAPALTVVSEATGYWPTLREIVEAAQITGPKVHDARIAALCLQHGIEEIWTTDRDFSRFPRLHVRNPLVAR